MDLKSVSILIIAVLFLYIIPVIAPAGPQPSSSSSSSSLSQGGGGGNSLTDIDNFLRVAQNWKAYNKDKFAALQKLLSKSGYSDKYTTPDVWLYYPPTLNTIINRTDKISIGAVIRDDNPLELRKALYLILEIQEPGETEFKPANAGAQIIQPSQVDDTTHTTPIIYFPEITSLKFLKRVGAVKFRIRWTDGENKLDSSRENPSLSNGYYPVLDLNVKNIPPKINNSTVYVEPKQARWDDYIYYSASFDARGKAESVSSEKGQDNVKVTLHVYNQSRNNLSREIFNYTKPFVEGSAISFSTNDNKIFNEMNAGGNYSFAFSCTDDVKDGLNTSWSEMKSGPRIKQNPKIKAKGLYGKDAEDDNYYWWQKYTFGLEAKSLNPEGADLTVSLYTDTPSHPGKFIGSQTVQISSGNFTPIIFPEVQPFDVLDSNKNFIYYFTYSQEDEEGNRESQHISAPMILNSKLVKYWVYSPEMAINLIVILLLPLAAGILIERRTSRKGGR